MGDPQPIQKNGYRLIGFDSSGWWPAWMRAARSEAVGSATRKKGDKQGVCVMSLDERLSGKPRS
jgi:hypothetical protein